MVADPAIASDIWMRRIQMSRHKFVEALKEWYFSVGRLTSERSPNTTCLDPPRSKSWKPFFEIISSFLSAANGKKQKYGRVKKAFSLGHAPHLYGARGKQFWSISLRSFGFTANAEPLSEKWLTSFSQRKSSHELTRVQLRTKFDTSDTLRVLFVLTRISLTASLRDIGNLAGNAGTALNLKYVFQTESFYNDLTLKQNLSLKSRQL